MTFGAFFLHPELLSEASFLCLRWLFWWVPVSQKNMFRKHEFKSILFAIMFLSGRIWDHLYTLTLDAIGVKEKGLRFSLKQVPLSVNLTSIFPFVGDDEFLVVARHVWLICPRCFLSKGRSWPIFWCTQGASYHVQKPHPTWQWLYLQWRLVLLSWACPL